jgi:hypothetical protein
MRQGCRSIKIGDSTAIICGGEPNDHKCNENSTVYGFSDGFRGTLFDKARIEGLNLDMCEDDKIHFLREKDIQITSMSVACSVCGRAAMDNAMWM